MRASESMSNLFVILVFNAKPNLFDDFLFKKIRGLTIGWIAVLLINALILYLKCFYFVF